MEEIPEFQAYYPRSQMMNRKQKAFYQFLVSEIEHGRYPSVDGNISYLFAYTYPVMKAWRKKGFEFVFDALMELGEAYYYEEKYASYCRYWAYDCLLGDGKFERYLELTTPQDWISASATYANDRCNIFYHLDQHLPFIDFLTLFGWKQNANLTHYSLMNPDRFWACFQAIGTLEEAENGPWLERFFNGQPILVSGRRGLFIGTPMNQPELGVPFYNFDLHNYDAFVDLISKLAREAENKLRQEDNVPLVGEGWVSETALYKAVRDSFPQTTVVHHGRPLWLGRQHLDVWLPVWNIAIEFHGSQHFEPVEFFGGAEAFEATRERDERKAELCAHNGVKLLVATANDTHQSVIQKIQRLHEADS
mgnify:CR=1 FL=1